MSLHEKLSPSIKDVIKYDPITGVFTNLVNRGGRALEGKEAGTIHGTGYRMIRFDKKLILAHRLAWFYVHGQFPDNQIDHINGNRLDNRILNLRLATNKQNAENVSLRADNKTGVRGVCWSKRYHKWVARVGHNGVHIHVGLFSNLASAAAAVKKARDLLFTHHHTDYSA